MLGTFLNGGILFQRVPVTEQPSRSYVLYISHSKIVSNQGLKFLCSKVNVNATRLFYDKRSKELLPAKLT